VPFGKLKGTWTVTVRILATGIKSTNKRSLPVIDQQQLLSQLKFQVMMLKNQVKLEMKMLAKHPLGQGERAIAMYHAENLSKFLLENAGCVSGTSRRSWSRNRRRRLS
jgi:hypothetical protein